jgi:hypothetical protein
MKTVISEIISNHSISDITTKKQNRHEQRATNYCGA